VNLYSNSPGSGKSSPVRAAGRGRARSVAHRSRGPAPVVGIGGSHRTRASVRHESRSRSLFYCTQRLALPLNPLLPEGVVKRAPKEGP
jgi:hypothetical protein